MTDEQVMLEVHKGDLDKATILFERYHIRLFNFFVRMTYDKELSQDMTQTVFERVLKYRTSYKYGKQFTSWIFQIARNVRNDHYQKVEKRQANFTDIESISQESSAHFDNGEAREREQILIQAMSMLDEEQREILVLSKYQKLKYEEIATILDCSVSAAKVKAHRAIKKLRGLYFMVEAQ